MFYPEFRRVGATRRELGIPTTFNLLGPLANPARPSSALVGCAFREKARTLAEVLARRGTEALVVRGDDGLDEVTTTTTSTVWAVSGGRVSEHTLDPARLGFPRGSAADLRGGDAEDNAEAVRRLVRGETGPVRDAVLLNAAAALAAFTGLSGRLEDDVAAGVERAARAIDSGAAADLLDRWVRFSAALR
ncbi:anthranilate phosphoribosyltransferase [Thermobifida halotolerans]